MPSSHTGDLSESYFHLSSDQSDRLSSSDDSAHTIDDISTFLRLAKEHDRNSSLTRANDGTSHSHRYRSQTHSQADGNGTFATTQAPWDRAPSGLLHTESVPSNRPQTQNIDAASIFQALQPFLERYLASKNTSEQHRSSSADRDQHDYSDQDSKIDDTFDAQKHSDIRAMPHSFSSPVTSPPQSSGLSNFSYEKDPQASFSPHSVENTETSNRGADDSDVCRPIMPVVQNQPPPKSSSTDTQSQHMPHLDIGDLTADEIDMDFDQKSEQSEQVPQGSVQETIDHYKSRLAQYENDNRGLLNELQYLKSKLDLLTNEHATNPNFNSTSKDSKSQHLSGGSSNNDCASHAVPTITKPNTQKHDGFQNSLPEQFRPYYSRLQLDKVDQLSEDEKCNLIKNLMLSLLISDFDHLSTMAPKVGSYLRMTTRFLDALHSKLYPTQEMKPSQYLRNYALDINSGLQECLDGILDSVV